MDRDQRDYRRLIQRGDEIAVECKLLCDVTARLIAGSGELIGWFLAVDEELAREIGGRRQKAVDRNRDFPAKLSSASILPSRYA